MEEFALKIQLISQETLRASLAAWLDFWTRLVFLGVALEVVNLIWEYASDWKDFWRRVFHTPEKPTFAKFLIGVIAGGLVVVGIGGELNLQIRMGEAESKIERTADELLAREERARTAMLLQLQPRDFTEKQMEDFVASIKGKVADLNVFTLPDPESSHFGFAVMAGLQRAGVKVSWYPTTSPYFLVPGVSSIGLTIWDDPTRKVSRTLSDAFAKAGQSSVRFSKRPANQNRPGLVLVSSIPVPALFIALKQPVFMRFPEWGGSVTLLPQPRKPPWEQ